MPKYRLRTWYVECGPDEEIEADTPRAAINIIENGPDRWMIDCDELYCAELHVLDEDGGEEECVAALAGRPNLHGGNWEFDRSQLS